jgi:hypothetical protein
MANISSTSIDTIIDTQVSSVLNQQQPAIQDIGTILDDDSQNKFYDKIGQGFKALIKILSIIKTISKYALWLKYIFAFVIFILLPLGIFALYNLLWILIKGLILIFKETFKYFFAKKQFQNNEIEAEIIVPLNQLPSQIVRNVSLRFIIEHTYLEFFKLLIKKYKSQVNNLLKSCEDTRNQIKYS